MTSQPSVVCTKCGFLNEPGDQFCGSCGAFLEWEGSPVGGSSPGNAAASGAAGPATPGLGASAGPSPTTAPPGGAPAAGASSNAAATGPIGGSAPSGQGAAGLVRCPACGVANAATRTFCQSCGARLAAAAKVAPRSREEIAAAVAALPKSTATPGAPGATRGPGARPGLGAPPVNPSAQRSRGLPLWIVVVVIAGILIGGGVIVVPSLLRGNGPVSVASSDPSGAGAASAAASARASASTTPSGSGSAAASSSSPSAPAAKTLHLTSASASSVVQGDTAKYGAGNAIDGNPKTSWQEGATNEKGQWLEVTFDPATVTAVLIRNGYGASTALYKGNQRLKDVQISIDGGQPITVRLKDTPNAQRVDLPPTPGATQLRITIVTTYPSVKTSVAGTPFDDAAVSEVSVLGMTTP